mmetsp:Transcript_6841/g.10485  ORF Transcript_6841/g.10485 Transcript_6841/m.10485 type:complete len:349 (+) Transcript_6841:118-1164(+)
MYFRFLSIFTLLFFSMVVISNGVEIRHLQEFTNASQLRAALDSGTRQLIGFLSQHCGHCTQLKEAMATLQFRGYTDRFPIEIGLVFCDKQPQLCDDLLLSDNGAGIDEHPPFLMYAGRYPGFRGSGYDLQPISEFDYSADVAHMKNALKQLMTTETQRLRAIKEQMERQKKAPRWMPSQLRKKLAKQDDSTDFKPYQFDDDDQDIYMTSTLNLDRHQGDPLIVSASNAWMFTTNRWVIMLTNQWCQTCDKFAQKVLTPLSQMSANGADPVINGNGQTGVAILDCSTQPAICRRFVATSPKNLPFLYFIMDGVHHPLLRFNQLNDRAKLSQTVQTIRSQLEQVYFSLDN